MNSEFPCQSVKWEFPTGDNRSPIVITLDLFADNELQGYRNLDVRITGLEHPYMVGVQGNRYFGEKTKNPAAFNVARYISQQLQAYLEGQITEGGIARFVPDFSKVAFKHFGIDEFTYQASFEDCDVHVADPQLSELFAALKQKIDGLSEGIKQKIEESSRLQPSVPGTHGDKLLFAVRLQRAENEAILRLRGSGLFVSPPSFGKN